MILFNRKERQIRRDNFMEAQFLRFPISALSAVIHKDLIERMESI